MNGSGDGLALVRISHRRRIGLLLALALLASGCRGGLPGGGLPEAETDPETPTQVAGASDCGMLPSSPPQAEVALGAYQADPRAADLAARWPRIVTAAAGRLYAKTGLAFAIGAAPRVVLKPFGDEALTHDLQGEIVDGRRVSRLEVNLEVLAASRRDAETLVAEGLAEAVFADAGARGSPVDRWVVAAARIAGGRGVEVHLVDLARRETKPVVDATGGTDPEATGLAALLVLAAEGGPQTTWRFFRFASEGDAPSPFLARLLEDPLGAWDGDGRRRLEAALQHIDTAPFALLDDAREALETTGPAGLETSLPTPIPAVVEAEIQVLRAEAAAAEGDHERARGIYRRLDGRSWADLEDPAASVAAWIRAEDREGGDPARLARLLDRFELDFPKAAARAAEVPEVEGGNVIDTRFRIARLLQGHRAGAAQRLIASLGERALAPELEGVRLQVARAQESPSEASLTTNRKRVRQWLVRPTPATADAVKDGGTAAARAVVEALRARQVASRSQAIDLLAQTADAGPVVLLLAPLWEANPRVFSRDLDVLLGRIPYHELRIWVEGHAPGALARMDAEGLWTGLRYGLDPAFIQADPHLLGALRSADFAERRDAFRRAVDVGEATPELVAKAMADPAILLRREAAIVAGRLGFRALLALALRDTAWAVRQAAVPAVGGVYGAEANRTLLPLLAGDPSPQVRMAAAAAVTAAGRPSVADALLRALDDGHPGVRRTAQAAIRDLDAVDALPAIHRALLAERARPAPRALAYARLFVLFEEMARWQLGYDPGMGQAEVDALIGRVGEGARRVLSSVGRGPIR